jgi:hypothetical protein
VPDVLLRMRTVILEHEDSWKIYVIIVNQPIHESVDEFFS